jgi:tetratricopeptide (TPR) repeat protein
MFKDLLKYFWPLCASAVLLLGGCTKIAQSLYLASYDRDIKNAGHAIESARDDGRRASAYSQRGTAYSEKARYCRTFKLITPDDYSRLFSLATKDHEQAIALAPESAEAYFSRGRTYYDRGTVEQVNSKDAQRWFNLAGADFQKTIDKDRRHPMGWDMLGLVHEQAGDLDKAIDDYTQEMALHPYGRVRLAEAYCVRGSRYRGNRDVDRAALDYEKSIELAVASDSCSCDPYNPLIGIYDEVTKQYDKAWEVVHKAQKAKRWIAPEWLEKLQKHSGRNN